MDDRMEERFAENLDGTADRLTDELMAAPDEEAVSEAGISPERVRRNREFLKGVLFGVLISWIIVLIILLARFGTFGSGSAKGKSLISGDTRSKLVEIASIINHSAMYDVDEVYLADCLFKGVAYGLGDPYAAYYSVDEMKAMTRSLEGQYRGIGITVTQDQDGVISVLEVKEGYPAEKAGMLPGDVLTAIDGKRLDGLTLDDAVNLIADAEGELSITVLRDGQEMTVKVTPGQIVLAGVEYEMLDDTIGYLHIPEFNTLAVTQFEEAVEELTGAGMQKLIIDVRGNPGGLLTSVCRILDDLLPEGLIVTTMSKEGDSEKVYSDEKQLFAGPLAVLVNGLSASASEVFAGAVQDYSLGPVVGAQTYGKGVVQWTYSLSDGSAFKLTTEKYLTPAGRDIDGVGITPDLPVAEDDREAEADLQLEKAMEYLRTGESDGI